MKKTLMEKAYEDYLKSKHDKESERPFYECPKDILSSCLSYVNFLDNNLFLFGYIEENFPKLSRARQETLWYKNRYPILIGIAEHEVCILKNVKQVAKFICRNGVKGDVCVANIFGEPFLDTLGLYINKIADQDYLVELKKILIPMQKRIEKKIFKKA